MTPKTPADFALWAALPMAHTSKVESRLQMVLDTTRRRTSPRRFLLFAAVTGAIVVVPLSMLRPAAQADPMTGAPMRAAQAQSSAAAAFNWALETQYARENAKFLRGQHFSPQEAAEQEQRLVVQPNDYTAHLCLLGYDWTRSYQSRPSEVASVRLAYRQQVFWLIRNHPESLLFSRAILGVPRHSAPAAFEGDKALWQAQFVKYPSSADILGNAAEYYLLSNEVLAEKYLLQAQALEPQNPQWPSKLGELYRLEGEGPRPSAATVKQSAKKALTEYEAAATLAGKTGQSDTSADLAKTAFNAGEYDKARTYAEALLKRGEDVAAAGRADPRTPAFIFHVNNEDIHEASLILGRLAVHDGNLTEAGTHLLVMGRVSGSSSLDAFGPNMQLARDLLERGDRQPVLAYFDECAKFWHDKRLGAWRSEVEQGKIPDFGGNLDY